MRLAIEDILKATGGRLTKPDSRSPMPLVTGVSTDTRSIQPGDLFVPLRGPRADGHDFIPEAFRHGAVATLASRRVPTLPDRAVVIEVPDTLRALGRVATAHRRTLDVAVVGITGSVGKTTTTKMCAAVLSTRYRVAQTKEDWNSEIGVPLTLLSLDREHEVAVIEMGMRGLGQIAELVEMAQPSIGVVTSIGESHLELLGSIENIARAKGELIAGLPGSGTAILNEDDARTGDLSALAPSRVLTFGLSPEADVRGANLRMDGGGMTFFITMRERTVEAHVRTWGRHNVMNALTAAAAGTALDVDLEDVVRGLKEFSPPKMRLQPVRLGDVLLINDAYNASPASMRAAFEVLLALGTSRRRLAVLGEMRELGEASESLHRDVGATAAAAAELLITVGAGARAIAEGALEAGVTPGHVHHTASTDQASAVLKTVMRSGDVILIKGSRALEMERIVEALQRE
ncbi:MAG: UDP-N-acetylmuramoyl-tripeptide--D-alanyl-D-alanine ligase [bacterium]